MLHVFNGIPYWVPVLPHFFLPYTYSHMSKTMTISCGVNTKTCMSWRYLPISAWFRGCYIFYDLTGFFSHSLSEKRNNFNFYSVIFLRLGHAHGVLTSRANIGWHFESKPNSDTYWVVDNGIRFVYWFHPLTLNIDLVPFAMNLRHL